MIYHHMSGFLIFHIVDISYRIRHIGGFLLRSTSSICFLGVYTVLCCTVHCCQTMVYTSVRTEVGQHRRLSV